MFLPAYTFDGAVSPSSRSIGALARRVHVSAKVSGCNATLAAEAVGCKAQGTPGPASDSSRPFGKEAISPECV